MTLRSRNCLNPTTCYKWNESSATIFLKLLFQNPATIAVRKRPLTVASFSVNVTWNKYSQDRDLGKRLLLPCNSDGDAPCTLLGVKIRVLVRCTSSIKNDERYSYYQ